MTASGDGARIGGQVTRFTPTLCRRCGQLATCMHCGSLLEAEAGLVARVPAPRTASSPPSATAQHAQLQSVGLPRSPTVAQPAAGELAYRFEPARIVSGPLISRKGWLKVGVSGVVVTLAVVAFLVLRPAPPTPAGAVLNYFADLGRGDTASALARVDTSGEGFSSDSAPLLVSAALATAENRPTGAIVTSSRTNANGGGGRFTAVTVTYEVGGRRVGQVFGVAATGDKKTPYLLEQPFVYLTVEASYRLAATVNGIAVDADTLARGTPAFPGLYQATTAGSALFAWATQVATYQADGQRVRADIEFGQPALAPGASQAVQAAAQEVLDGACVNPPAGSAGYSCPLQAPYESYDQTTMWNITTYPQVQLSPVEQGRSEVGFTTGTTGSANYTITYTDFGGITQTESGTVPIEISGYAEVDDNGDIQITLGS